MAHLRWPLSDLVVVVLPVELPRAAVCQVVLDLELGEDGQEFGRFLIYVLSRVVTYLRTYTCEMPNEFSTFEGKDGALVGAPPRAQIR